MAIATRGRRLRIFISEWTLPTDHVNHEFNFWMTRAVQASWLADALRIVRGLPALYTLGWHALYDEPPRPAGDEVNAGCSTTKAGASPRSTLPGRLSGEERLQVRSDSLRREAVVHMCLSLHPTAAATARRRRAET